MHWRKKKPFNVTALILMLIFIGAIFGTMGKCAFGFELSIKKTLKFGAGIVGSVAIHEAGHAVLLETKGRDYNFHFKNGFHPSFTYKGSADTLIQMGGLMANALSSEAIFLIPKEERGAFWNGFLIGNAIEEITYPILRHTKGDFKPLNKEQRLLYGGLSVLHGGLTLYRVYKADHFNAETWLGITNNGTPMGGFKIRW